MSELIRQGEILLLPTPSVLFGARESVRNVVVGHSESGHHHVLDCDIEFDVITTGDELLIDLHDTARLIHQATTDRHDTLVVPPGTYRVVRKRQYDPVRDGIGFVAD
jgi:hypothetical protein